MTKPSPAIGSAEGQQSELATEWPKRSRRKSRRALSQVAGEFATSIVFDRWLVSGLSGAPGRVSRAERPIGPRKVVMKVCPPGQTTGGEPTRHERALKDAPPKFAERHLVRQPVQPVKAKGGWSVMFQEIAGGSMRGVRALSALRDRQLPGPGCRRRVLRVGRLEPRA